MNNEILKKALIPRDKWEFCYISDNIIYTPIYDEENRMLKTGKEVYDKSKLPFKSNSISTEKR